MKDFIEALTIFLKYSDTKYPTHCEHEKLTVCVDPALVTKEDTKELKRLGFIADKGEGNFYSFRFGSC